MNTEGLYFVRVLPFPSQIAVLVVLRSILMIGENTIVVHLYKTLGIAWFMALPGNGLG